MPQKMKIKVFVDSDVLKTFKNHVFAKYGTLHKYLSEELTKAITDYLRASRYAHTKFATHTFKGQAKASQLLKGVMGMKK